MNALETDPLENVVELDAGPGQRLRQGRENANLSVEEVAARLHLDTRTVRCLEADQYEDLPAPTFVRGYLRSYARLLNLAQQPIVDGFDRRGLEPPALIADISTNEEASSADAPMRVATASIVFVLVAGVALWWQSQIGTEWLVRTPGDDTESSTPPALGPTLPRLDPGEPQTEDQSLAASGAALPPVTVVEPQSTTAPLPAPAVAVPVGTSTSVDLPAPAAASSNPPGVGHLVVRVRRDSWVEIYDRNGERLYYSTGKAGDTIDVSGPEPLDVLLGFAEGVRLEYNDQPYDPSAHTVRGLARFKLGE